MRGVAASVGTEGGEREGEGAELAAEERDWIGAVVSTLTSIFSSFFASSSLVSFFSSFFGSSFFGSSIFGASIFASSLTEISSSFFVSFFCSVEFSVGVEVEKVAGANDESKLGS